MVSRFAAFVIWAAIAASIVFWGMRLLARPAAVPAHALVVSTASGFNGDPTRVLGNDPPAPRAAVSEAAPVVPADARFKLLGVVAPRPAAASAQGLALIALDGKPAKTYRVGSAVDGDLVLLGVHSRGASLGARGQPAQFALELPAMPLAATGVPGAGIAPRPGIVVPGRPGQQRLPADGQPESQPPEPSDRADEPVQADKPPATPPGLPGRMRQPA